MDNDRPEFRKINELHIILKAALADGVNQIPYPDESIISTLLGIGFDLRKESRAQDRIHDPVASRTALLRYIERDNGASLKGARGVGPHTFNAILLYLLNT